MSLPKSAGRSGNATKDINVRLLCLHGLSFDGLIDECGDHFTVVKKLSEPLNHEHDGQILLGIDPKYRARGSSPAVISNRASLRCLAVRHPHREPRAKPIARSGHI